MKLSRDIRSSDGKLYRYYARMLKGQWLVNCTVYGRDGYYRADLSFTDCPATDRDIDNIFDR